MENLKHASSQNSLHDHPATETKSTTLQNHASHRMPFTCQKSTASFTKAALINSFEKGTV